MKPEWKIAHPGTGEWITCASFKEAFDAWFEGWNVPRLIVDGAMEPFSASDERVQQYYKDGGGVLYGL